MTNKRIKLVILGIIIAMALAALWLISKVDKQIRISETEKVRIWAGAINQKAELMSYSERFFNQVALDEQRKIQLYAGILRSFADPDLNSDMEYSLAYVNYITDSCKTSLIITDANNIITSCRNIFNDSLDQALIGRPLEGELLEHFSENEPLHYRIWGMPTTLYYRESELYTELRSILHKLNKTFLDEITNNSVFVPVIIVDSTRTNVLGHGNIPEHAFATQKDLDRVLRNMARDNAPIEIILSNSNKAFVYYEKTPLLMLLEWVPIVYIFIALVLLITTYYLFRTTRTMEQNRIWVGMAKETAHQLGTPISSLIAWTEYLEGKNFEPKYSQEVKKDLSRLETITHRFSKIGSIPELKDEDVRTAITNATNYLQSRTSRRVKFVLNLPDEPLIAPLNSYLFEWVIENLCKNAIDAMDGQGTFSIIASADTKNIYIDVSDTGKGIPTANQKRIFESGFTTKQRGWGLGLSLAKRIINEYHRGKIYLKYSLPSQGSVFRIELKRTHN